MTEQNVSVGDIIDIRGESRKIIGITPHEGGALVAHVAADALATAKAELMKAGCVGDTDAAAITALALAGFGLKAPEAIDTLTA